MKSSLISVQFNSVANLYFLKTGHERANKFHIDSFVSSLM